MKRKPIAAAIAAAVLALLFFAPTPALAQVRQVHQVLAQSTILNGLAAGALFPYLDTTPNRIASAHITIADATTNCSPGAAEPLNIQVLAGVAGGTLVNVITAATNTGIGTATQCVFHVTIRPGEGGVPAEITDLVVKNNGAAPLTGINTISVSAEVPVVNLPAIP
jgi:hypothetical protein